ncbi:sugar phosphate isomerase/epimerase family protein [Haloprofundus salinisoli]|uniref:sugar phosphate isomerase/epimerase family protein n=1 Tax=Haloprofundus salinisoli TaxID=2876193 RepID=UPI001CCD03C5|nr:sugar phosphate isomerase/epimerase [Haloprofundus salinisoli]
MKLGLCTISNRELQIGDVLAVADRAGYDGVELWGGDHLGSRSDAACEDARVTAKRRGLDIPVYGSYLRPGTATYADEVERELAIAQTLEAAKIRVWAGREEYETRTEHHWERVVEDLCDLSDRAADRGLAVTVEKHGGTLTNSAVGAKQLLAAVDEENCRLNWQPLFVLPADEILTEAQELGPLANNVHLQAVPKRGLSGEHRCLLADAHYDVPAVIDALSAAGFDEYLEVEFVTDRFDYETAVTRDREYLTSLV